MYYIKEVELLYLINYLLLIKDSMDFPEPEPSELCEIYYTLDQLGFLILFFGAGVGWFVVGYLLSDCCYYRNRPRPNSDAILAESVQ